MKMQQKKREFSLGSVPDWVVVKVAKKRIALEILQKQRALPEGGEAFGNGRFTCSNTSFNYDQHFFLLCPNYRCDLAAEAGAASAGQTLPNPENKATPTGPSQRVDLNY